MLDEERHLNRRPETTRPAKGSYRFFDYAEAGCYSQETLRANRSDLNVIKFRQRVLVDVSARNLSTTILGERVSLHSHWHQSPWRVCSTATAKYCLVARRKRLASRSRRVHCRYARSKTWHSGGTAILVSTLRHEGSRFRSFADRARGYATRLRAIESVIIRVRTLAKISGSAIFDFCNTIWH